MRASPGRYHGWRIVAALAVTETVSFGILYYAFTVFVTPMRLDLGWSTATITGAFSLSLLVAGACAPFVGRALDRHGARGLMSAGSVLGASALLAWSSVGAPWALYAAFVLLGVASALVLYESAFAVVAVWFERRRSAALTVLTFVAGFASVIFVPVAALLVEALGWREALRALAVVQLVATLPLHALVLRRRPDDVGQHVDGEPYPAGDGRDGRRSAPGRGPASGGAGAARGGARAASLGVAEATASRDFRLLTLAFASSMAVALAMGVHTVPILLRRGLDPLEAASVAAAVGLVALPGRLVFTPLGAVWPRPLVTASIFVLQALGLLALLLVPGPLGLYTFVALFGAGFGAITPARAALVAETFGPAHYGAIAGRLLAVGTLARAAAPFAFGAVVTAAGSDTPGLVGLVLLSATAAVAVARVGRPRRYTSGAERARPLR